jgi:molybdopterin molybdotransferase
MAEQRYETLEVVSLEEAQERVLTHTAPLAAELVGLGEARGRVLAEEILADRDEPLTPLSAVDGYAVCSADLASASAHGGVVLKLVGSVTAGQSGGIRVKRGEAVRVATGAAVPAGADAVVPHEATFTRAGEIRVTASVEPGSSVVPVGAEFYQDQHLLAAGSVLGALELAVVSTLGHRRLAVRRRPRIAVLATGDELVAAGAGLEPGKLVASNLVALFHLVDGCGGQAVNVGVVQDRVESISHGIQRGLEADALVTTGGTGKGEKDLLCAAVARLGGALEFRQVAMHPGRQSLLAMVEGKLLFGLPGRPSAVHIAFGQLVRPAVLRMLGLPRVTLPEIGARLPHPIRTREAVHTFLRCRVTLDTGEPRVQILRPERMSPLTEMLAGNALLKVPPGREALEPGEEVQVQLLDLGLEGLGYFGLQRTV